MDDDVVHAVDGRFDKIEVQNDIAGLGATPPAASHPPNRHAGACVESERWGLFQTGR